MDGRRIAKEVKDEVLRKIRSGRAVKDVAEEHGLKASCVYSWLGNEPKVGDRSETLELSRLKRENEALLKLLGRLTYESELRKKSELVQTSPELGKYISKTTLARELGVSRSSLYYQRKMEARDEELRLRIEAVMLEHPSYGHRRVADELEVNRKAVLRVMRLYQLKPARSCQTPSKPKDRGLPASEAPDILRRVSPVAPSCIWTSDFTFISYKGRFLYFCVVRDHFTKEVMGHSIRTHHTSELVLAALNDAFIRRKAEPPVWLHSDQGSEYQSSDVKRELSRHGIRPSYAPKSSPWRNGAQESFFPPGEYQRAM